MNSNKLPRNKVIDRVRLLQETIRDKSVLHIGCTDYPYTKQKIQDHSLLHFDLMASAQSVMGIDLSAESVEMMTDSGIKNIHCVDIYKLNENKVLSENNFDYIIFSEVIEHLPNAGLALETIHKFISKTNKNTELIITAPNIHNFFFRFIEMITNKENVHPDHYYYFSYRTLSKLLSDTGFEITDAKYILYRKKSFIYRPLLWAMNIFTSSYMPYILFKCKITH